MNYFILLLIIFSILLIYIYTNCKKPKGDSRILQALMSYGKLGEAKQYDEQCDWSK